MKNKKQNKLKATDLKNIIVPSDTVVVNDDQYFTVYGLPLQDMMQVFENYIDFLDSLATGNMESLGVLLKDAPELAASIVCRASGDMSDEGLENFLRLPTQIQSDALLKVMKLTFPDEELLGKWWSRLEEVAANLAKGYQNQMSQVNQTNQSGK